MHDEPVGQQPIAAAVQIRTLIPKCMVQVSYMAEVSPEAFESPAFRCCQPVAPALTQVCVEG
jgi:hypothetical protein